ncbi:putative 43kDa postsynaptic protein [Medicago truncatula]|uniref:Kinesin light chain n=1 Tax=Medicago truncatula TaxID=3880 RepID=G7JNV9_MEDTR|nr:protein KINESIN LIGHT CHAIN-RELATED 3 [Medicago truncatula]AES91162.1 kinesin light chain [Medicago truncatula]RHN63517.1 putative 43kDa postsynaptic protein [Medicago truncatula]
MPSVVPIEGNKMNELENPSPSKNIYNKINSPRIPSSPQTPRSVERFHEIVHDARRSRRTRSSQSFGSDSDWSLTDSEFSHISGEQMRKLEIVKEEMVKKVVRDSSSETPSISRAKGKNPPAKPPVERKNGNNPLRKQSTTVTNRAVKPKIASIGRSRSQSRVDDSKESTFDNPELGPFLLKKARDLISLGENPRKALELSLQATKLFEKSANGKPSLDLVMCLHVTAAIYCSLGHYNEAIPILERSIEIPAVEEGKQHAIAKFASHMQLGDTYAMLGQLENSIMCYNNGLEVQRKVLGVTDPRVGETCRYIAEANFQALQFDEAERLCQIALDIHRENGSPSSLEEVADRRLIGLICETNGNHEAALEHLVLASMAMVSNGQEVEVASVDCSIGDTFLSLARYDEAILAYKKALAVFKTHKGGNHPSVGSVLVRLAELYNRTWKVRESKSYCENALKIYENPMPGVPSEEIASGFVNVAAIYESMNELEQALELLHKALEIHNDAPGQQNTIAGIEAQMGVIYYVLGNQTESYNAFKNAVSKLRATGEKKSAFFGFVLNQMGLCCVQLNALSEAVKLFEEAKIVLEQEYGPCHPETLGVYSNLAGTYDAIGRVDDAIDIIEYIVVVREEKLGTAHFDVVDEKRRLDELLKETGRVRKRKTKSLEILLDVNED